MINYYEIEIKGQKANNFFEKIIKEKINIFDIKHSPNIITFKTTYQDYQKILKLNTIYELKIKNIKGINRYKNILKFYKIFFIFFLLSILFILLYSKMIFKITINTKNEELKEIINEELIKNHITIFSFKKSFTSLEQIILNIKNNNRDKIEWISIKENGIAYEVNLIEKISKDIISKNGITNIVAKENGYIKDMYIEKGQVLKNNGDYVTKGEIIVSGLILKNENIKNTVSASGKVFAEVWYKVKVSDSINTYKQVDKDGFFKINFTVFNKEFTLIKFKIKNLNKNKTISIINNDLFNLSIKKEYKKNLVKTSRKVEELVKELEKEANKAISKNLLEKEYIMYEKTLKIIKYDDKIDVEVFFKVYKDIAEIKETSIP